MISIRDEWAIKRSPCESSMEAYARLSQRRPKQLAKQYDRCELFSSCPIIRWERQGSEGQLESGRQKIPYSGNQRKKEIDRERQRFLAELKMAKSRRRPKCVRRVAQEMAQEIVLVKMQSSSMSFEQAAIDTIIEFNRSRRKQNYYYYDETYGRWIEVKGIKNAWSEIIDFMMLIIGQNGNGFKP